MRRATVFGAVAGLGRERQPMQTHCIAADTHALTCIRAYARAYGLESGYDGAGCRAPANICGCEGACSSMPTGAMGCVVPIGLDVPPFTLPRAV